MFTAIVAMSDNGVIGNNNDIPWRQKNDMLRFKKVTLGHPCIMGRKTFESIMKRIGKPLPRRENVILSSTMKNAPHGARIISASDLSYYQKRAGKEDVFVIGGSEVYTLTRPLTKQILLTRVHAQIQGDAFFPPLSLSAWKLMSDEVHRADDDNQYPYSYQQWQRI